MQMVVKKKFKLLKIIFTFLIYNKTGGTSLEGMIELGWMSQSFVRLQLCSLQVIWVFGRLIQVVTCTVTNITSLIVYNIKERHIASLLCEERNIFEIFIIILVFFSFQIINRRTGSGNRCCYDHGGNLMYTNDTHSGSTPGKL